MLRQTFIWIKGLGYGLAILNPSKLKYTVFLAPVQQQITRRTASRFVVKRFVGAVDPESTESRRTVTDLVAKGSMLITVWIILFTFLCSPTAVTITKVGRSKVTYGLPSFIVIPIIPHIFKPLLLSFRRKYTYIFITGVIPSTERRPSNYLRLSGCALRVHLSVCGRRFPDFIL